jgi:hypothetical protein
MELVRSPWLEVWTDSCCVTWRRLRPLAWAFGAGRPRFERQLCWSQMGMRCLI